MDEAQYQQLMQMLQMYGGTPNNSMMQPYTQNMWNQQATQQQGQVNPYFNPNQQVQEPSLTPNIGTYTNPSFDLNMYNGQQMYQATESGTNTNQPLDVNTNNQTQNPNNTFNFLNALSSAASPVSTETATFRLGQSLAFNNNNPYATQGQKNMNTVRGIGAAGKTLTSLLRTGFAGAAYQNAYNDVSTQYQDRQAQKNFNVLEDGGSVQAATGNYIMGQPNPNAIIEDNEYVQYPNGQTVQAMGATHEKGGIPTNLPPQTRVISDNLKIGGKAARELKKEYDIDVKANHTYAEVIDKYKKKIGLDRAISEQEDYIKKLQTNTEKEQGQTTNINETFLAGKIQETEANKAPLQEQLNSFTDLVFRKQEEQKGDVVMENGVNSFADGGTNPYPFYTPNPLAENSYGYQPFLEGQTNAAGGINPNDRLQLQSQALPYVVNQSGLFLGGTPNLANTGAFQRSYDAYTNSVIAEIDANPYLSAEEKAANKTIAQKQLLQLSNQNGNYDGVYGRETSTRSSFVLPYLSEADKTKYSNLRFLGDVVDDKGNIKADYSQLSEDAKKLIEDTYKRGGANSLNIGLGTIRENAPQQAVAQVDENGQIILPTNAAMPFQGLNLVDQTLPPPGALQANRLADPQYRNYEAVAQGYENQVQQLYNQENAAVDQLQGLTPAQRAAAITTLSAGTQQAANQVIGQVNSANQQEQARINNANTDLFNRYQILDENNRNDYENKTFTAQYNTDTSLNQWFQYNNQLAAINQQQQLQAQTLSSLFANTTIDANGRVVSNGVRPILYNNVQAMTALNASEKDSKKSKNGTK